VTLVLLPLKYEIDDSVNVTVVLVGRRGAAVRLWARHKLHKFTECLLIHYTSAFLVVLFDESRNIFHYYTLSYILIRYARLHAPSASL